MKFLSVKKWNQQKRTWWFVDWKKQAGIDANLCCTISMDKIMESKKHLWSEFPWKEIAVNTKSVACILKKKQACESLLSIVYRWENGVNKENKLSICFFGKNKQAKLDVNLCSEMLMDEKCSPNIHRPRVEVCCRKPW